MAATDDPRLLALLSHELRAPAGVLAGYLKLLDREADLSERQRTLVQNALKAGDKLNGLLGDLRELLQYDSDTFRLERRAIPLQTLVTDVVSASASCPEAPVVAVGALPNVVLQIDRARVTAALAALVRAAARPLGQDATIHFRGVLDDAARVRLTIGAAAVPAETHEDAPLDESRAGLGLALPLARAIVSAHGGTIHEEVSTNGDSCFAVVLATTE